MSNGVKLGRLNTDNGIKWSVVCVGCVDAHVFNVDLFKTYNDAREFMLSDTQQFLKECNDHDLMLEDYGQEIVAFDGNYGAYRWIIKPTNIH